MVTVHAEAGSLRTLERDLDLRIFVAGPYDYASGAAADARLAVEELTALGHAAVDSRDILTLMGFGNEAQASSPTEVAEALLAVSSAMVNADIVVFPNGWELRADGRLDWQTCRAMGVPVAAVDFSELQVSA